MSTIQERLRLASRYTRLDADRELLTEAADEIDRLSAGEAADVTDERQAFDAWWESKQRETFPKDYRHDRLAGWGAAFKPDAWRAWQARSIIALRPVQAPMTDEQVDSFMIDGRLHWLGKRQIIRAVEAHHGIKPKEQA